MIGERIKEQLDIRGWTYTELAARMNVSRQTASNWANDNVMPSVDIVIRLSRLFRVTTDYLLGVDNRILIEIGNIDEADAAFIRRMIEYIENGKDQKN